MARRKSLKRRLEQGLQGSVARVRDGLESSREYVGEKAGFVSEKTKDFIRERPIESVLIAVGVGILIGAAVNAGINKRLEERRSWKNKLNREFKSWF